MPRILIVEDEPAIVMGLVDKLTSSGFTVDTAEDGPTGLDKARQGRFDLILLDWMLPGMDGLDVLKSLRREGVQTNQIYGKFASNVSQEKENGRI